VEQTLFYIQNTNRRPLLAFFSQDANSLSVITYSAFASQRLIT